MLSAGIVALGVLVACEKKTEPEREPVAAAPAPVTDADAGTAAPGSTTVGEAPSGTGTADGGALLPVGKNSADEPRKAEAKWKSAPKLKLEGTAELVETADGVRVIVELENAPPGKKGLHIHEKDDCSNIEGMSMGSHFNPDKKAHGLPHSAERHPGDLGNIEIGSDGKGRVEVVTAGGNLRPDDPLSFLGRAIVVHEAEDKGTQPTGGAGKPIGCAPIEKD